MALRDRSVRASRRSSRRRVSQGLPKYIEGEHNPRPKSPFTRLADLFHPMPSTSYRNTPRGQVGIARYYESRRGFGELGGQKSQKSVPRRNEPNFAGQP